MSVWIAETWLASTLLMALVLLLRRPVARWLGAGAAYMLWALPLARLLLPPLPRGVASATPLQSAVDHSGLATILAQPAAPLAASAPSGVTTGAMAPAAALPWVELAIGGWMLGVALFLAFHILTYIRFRRLILRDAVPVGREGRIHIVASPKATGPLAFGVLNPHVVLPLDFHTRFDPQERAMALAHECAHHQRGDLLANMIALGMLALHWCNPIAWIAWTRYRADQELACDARVLTREGHDNAHAYGRAILKAAGGRQFAAACHLNRIDTLKGRLKMLSTHADSLHRISWGMAAIALVTAAGLALTASGSRAAQEVSAITDRVQDASMARLASLMTEPPQAPDALAAPSVPQAPSAPEAPPAPATPDSVRAHAHASLIPAPPAPPIPAAPAADMVPPVPPVPPVSVLREDGRITVRHADGRADIHAIPTAADIRRMVPVVDVRNGCDGDQLVSERTTTLADGRQHVRVRICDAAIARLGRDEAVKARALARRQASADMAAARADIAAARAEMARDRSIPAAARAEALRSMDEAMAKMRGQMN